MRAYGSLLRFVRTRIDRPSDAQDIVQDAFARLIMSHEREEVRDPSAFLRAVALNLLRDRARAESVRRAVHHHGACELVECDAPSVERVIEGREQLEAIRAAVAELKPNSRAAFLHRVEGLSHAETAVKLGVSVSMVEKHVRHAVRHCRKRLAEANGDD